MKQSFTKNSLIKFIYNEVSTSEKLAISEALSQDVQLRKEYYRLKAAQAKLPQVKFNAPRSVLDNILQHNRNTAFEKAK